MSLVQTEFGVHSDFLESLMILAKKGGPGQRAADRVMKAYDKAIKANASFDDVFEGIPLTNHGEGRINNCRKFDLTGFARLVTTYNRNVCIFLFAGTHDDVDRWLQKNRGLDFIGRSEGKTIRLSPVYVSDVKNQDVGFIDSNIDLQSEGPIIDLLDERDKNQLLAGLSLSLCGELKTITSITSDDQILKLLSTIEPGRQCDAIFDVLIDLRASDKVKAKNRIDQYSGVAKLLAEIPDKALTEVVSSESIVMVQDIDPVLFQHFVRTANFKQWMLYLHPAQRSIVERRFEGSARLAGVSGSGKTCVVVHRAVRLARADESKSVLIITLNDALSKLISDLVVAQCGALQPKNIQIKSIFQLCAEHLAQLEPDKKDYYTRRTTVKNQFASSEHIDEIWREFFHCEANNRSADVMMDLVKTLAVRGVCSQDYIRQELDYVRSAFSEDERKKYLDMERTGRVVPLTKPYRKTILAGLDGWERKMAAVGAVDDLGIVTALNKHINKLKPHFHHTLVDEVQDLGTLELEIIRKLTYMGRSRECAATALNKRKAQILKDKDIVLCFRGAPDSFGKAGFYRKTSNEIAIPNQSFVILRTKEDGPANAPTPELVMWWIRSEYAQEYLKQKSISPDVVRVAPKDIAGMDVPCGPEHMIAAELIKIQDMNDTLMKINEHKQVIKQLELGAWPKS